MGKTISKRSGKKAGRLGKRQIAKLSRYELLHELRRHIWPDSYRQACRMTDRYLRLLLESYEATKGKKKSN